MDNDVKTAEKALLPNGIGEKIDEWRLWLFRYSDETQKTYIESLDLFFRWSPVKIRHYADISIPLLVRYQIDLIQTFTKATANKRIAAVKSFCHFLGDVYGFDDYGENIHFVKPDPPKQRFLTDAEYDLITTGSGKIRDQLVFITQTGLRVSEFCGLDRDNYGPASISFIGKGNKRRTVPLNKTALALAAKYRFRINFTKSNLKIKRTTMLGNCYRMADSIGIDRFSPHSLRHYFATALLTRGVSIQIVSKLLGHSSISITEKTYIHILPDHLAGVTDVLG